MLVQSLEIIRYPTNNPIGEAWEAKEFVNPEWELIVESLNRLDRKEFPYIWLHVGEHPEGNEPQLSLNVMGGRGEFAFCIFRNGSHSYFRDSNRGDAVVQIWESDQGSRVCQRELCNDQQLMLRIVRHFADNGNALSEVEWIDD